MKRKLDHSLPSFDMKYPCNRPEDVELTRYLRRHVAGALSMDSTPPDCFHCASSQVILRYRGRPPSVVPYFQCTRCNRGFNRRTGTALQNFLRADKVDEFLSLLSQQRPVASAAQELGVSPAMVGRWVRVFRTWLLKLDSTGYWEAKVKLGMLPDLPALVCPRCGNHEHFFRHGFVDGNHSGKRMFRCKRCSRCVAESDEHFQARSRSFSESPDTKTQGKKTRQRCNADGFGALC